MGLEYDFYPNPLPKGSKRKPRLHARVVTKGTTDTEQLARIIHDQSTLTTGDVKAVLDSLSDLLIRELSYSRRVHIKGLGYFHLTLECPPVKTDKDIRAESIRVRTIVFRAEEPMKEKVRNMPLKRVARKNKSILYSEIEVDGLLTGHFLDNDYITGPGFNRLCGLTPSTGSRRLKELVDGQKLKRLGHRKSSVYVPVEGNYRK